MSLEVGEKSILDKAEEFKSLEEQAIRNYETFLSIRYRQGELAREVYTQYRSDGLKAFSEKVGKTYRYCYMLIVWVQSMKLEDVLTAYRNTRSATLSQFLLSSVKLVARKSKDTQVPTKLAMLKHQSEVLMNRIERDSIMLSEIADEIYREGDEAFQEVYKTIRGEVRDLYHKLLLEYNTAVASILTTILDAIDDEEKALEVCRTELLPALSKLKQKSLQEKKRGRKSE